MAGLSDDGREVALDALGEVAVYFSLHSADPGGSGANELAGGSPAYARQLGEWGAASGDEMTQSGSEMFDVPASSTVAYWGAWSAETSGTFYGSGALDETEVYAGQGQYELTGAKITLT